MVIWTVKKKSMVPAATISRRVQGVRKIPQSGMSDLFVHGHESLERIRAGISERHQWQVEIFSKQSSISPVRVSQITELADGSIAQTRAELRHGFFQEFSEDLNVESHLWHTVNSCFAHLAQMEGQKAIAEHVRMVAVQQKRSLDSWAHSRDMTIARMEIGKRSQEDIESADREIADAVVHLTKIRKEIAEHLAALMTQLGLELGMLDEFRLVEHSV